MAFGRTIDILYLLTYLQCCIIYYHLNQRLAQAGIV